VVLGWKIRGKTKIDICMYLYRSETDIILVPVKSSNPFKAQTPSGLVWELVE
jgi:hypothetical protein